MLNIPKYKEFLKASETEYVDRVVSPCGRLCLFNYTRQCTYDAAWNAVTVWARGIVFNTKTHRLVAVPFKKFFNFGEPQALWSATARKPDYMMEKLDGSFVMSFMFEDELWFTTRGSFKNIQTAEARRLWDRQEERQHPKRMALRWEVVSKATKNVVTYKEEFIALLGASTVFEEVSMESCNVLAEMLQTYTPWSEAGIPIAKAKKEADLYDHNKEGYVLVWVDNGVYRRVKVKGEKYCKAHRLIQGVNLRRVADMWYQSKSLGPEYPEETQAAAQEMCRELDDEVSKLKAKAKTELEKHEYNNRKELARSLGWNNPMFSSCMAEAGYCKDLSKLIVYKTKFNSVPRPITLKTL